MNKCTYIVPESEEIQIQMEENILSGPVEGEVPDIPGEEE